MPKFKNDKYNNGTSLGIEAELWQAADKLRGHLDAADYKSVVLGLIFLKYVSDMFEQVRTRVEAEGLDDPEDRDVYLAERAFWVPKEARWQVLQQNARQEAIGSLIDAAMEAIERDNPSLRGMLPGNYGRAALDKRRLGELVDLVSNKINFADEESRKQDTLGRVYEYFLSQFASQEGRKGGEFYTPRSVVRVLVEMLAPYKGRVFDPCCGSGGMFVQSEKFVEAHGGKIGDISIYGQESNPNTFKLAKMNLAIRGIEADLGKQPADSFHNDQHPDLKADTILANPPFNMSDWGGENLREDKRWKYGIPPAGNANFAWVQHFIHHLAPNGAAGFVLANGSMSSNTSGEGEIRKAIIEADLVDCMVALPGQLFYSTQIPVCLWFLTRNKKTLKVSSPDSHHVKQDSPANQDEGQSGKPLGSRDQKTLKVSSPDSHHVKQDSPANQDEGQSGKPLGSRDRRGEEKTLKVSSPDSHHVKQDSPANQDEGQSGKPLGSRDRRGEVLFIDARKLGTLTDRVHRDLSDEDIAKIAGTYHAWKDTPLPPGEGTGVRENALLPSPPPEGRREYADIPGFCKSVTIEEIRAQGYVLTPGRYVGAAEVDEDDEPFEQKMARLTRELEGQFEESARLEARIRKNLKNLEGV